MFCLDRHINCLPELHKQRPYYALHLTTRLITNIDPASLFYILVGIK